MHKHNHGFRSVFAAILGNSAITVIKFIGFALSGSGALFSEAIHSVADTFNQTLLMVGIRRSTKSANNDFSYGFGKERFLRALISACGIFFIGAGVTVYHGIIVLFEGHTILLNRTIFGILIISFVVESCTLMIALHELKKTDPESTWKERLRDGDPVTLSVVYEDSIAVLGVIIATGSLGMYYITGNPMRDSVGSIFIGCMLGVMAIILINKNRKYLIGKSIPNAIKKDIIEMLESEGIVDKVLEFRSTILDVNAYHIKCEIECNGTELIKVIGQKNFLKQEYEKVKDDYQDFLEFCIDFAGRVPRVLGTSIDEVEKRIHNKYPQIKYIDIELN